MKVDKVTICAHFTPGIGVYQLMDRSWQGHGS